MSYRYRKLYSGNLNTYKGKLLVWSLIFYGVMFYCLNDLIIGYFTNSSKSNNINLEEKDIDGFVVNTAGCKIPDFHPFDKQIKKYIMQPQTIVCNKGKPPLFESNLTSIYLLQSSLPAYDIKDFNDLNCCYNQFWRIDPDDRHSDTKFDYSTDCLRLKESANIEYEFINVTCYYDNDVIYKDMFSFIPVKNIQRLDPQEEAPLNVLIIGMDSVSRLNLHRQLPKTVEYLKNLGAVELLGFNKIADNTYPNLIPFLTGLTEDELNTTCVPHRKDHFDSCPFIWNHYKDQGYITAFGEDATYMGLFNNQGLKGFKKPPTDFGYNYFNGVVENQIGNNFFENVYFCQGSRYVYKDLLNYIQKFVTTMKENSLPYFGFFWGVSLSHDDLNMPSIGDEDYYEFFKSLSDQRILDNTAVMFISDHGIRFGKIRKTYQGRMEERLPFVFILLPEWFKNTHKNGVNNLMKNVRRLTTSFDLHETVIDLLYKDNISAENAGDDMEGEVIKSARGISLFKEISGDRTCEDAGIVSHWCTCQESFPLKLNETKVNKAVLYAVSYINQILENHLECGKLTLSEIVSARVMTHESEVQGKYTIRDYMVTFITLPGEAVFEATVRYSPVYKNLTVIGTISRLNRYSEQSSCITDALLRLYCFCETLVEDWVTDNDNMD